MTLTEFLLARIAEDEAAARAAQGLAPGNWRSRLDTSAKVLIERVSSRPLGSIATLKWAQQDEAEHIARHDPARVLAECKAKRRIVEQGVSAAQAANCARDGRTDLELAVVDAVDDAWHRALVILALPYANHPDGPRHIS